MNEAAIIALDYADAAAARGDTVSEDFWLVLCLDALEAEREGRS